MLAYALVAVSLAVAGHSLGRGDLPDPLALVVALGAALALGAWAQRTGSWWRVLLGLVLVQPLVHVLGRHGALDPRLGGVALDHPALDHHAHAVAVSAGSGTTTAMLVWHVLAVPLAALALVGVRRSLEFLGAALQRLRLTAPVAVPALRSLPVALAAPVLARPRPYLVVLRGNAPPCSA